MHAPNFPLMLAPSMTVCHAGKRPCHSLSRSDRCTTPSGVRTILSSSLLESTSRQPTQVRCGICFGRFCCFATAFIFLVLKFFPSVRPSPRLCFFLATVTSLSGSYSSSRNRPSFLRLSSFSWLAFHPRLRIHLLHPRLRTSGSKTSGFRLKISSNDSSSSTVLPAVFTSSQSPALLAGCFFGN